MLRLLPFSLIVLALLGSFSLPLAAQSDMNTSLVTAIETGDAAAFDAAIRAGADINTKTRKGAPILSAAILAGRRHMALELVASGANLNAQYMDYIGATPLMLAVQTKDMELATELLAAKADVDFRDTNGDPAINWAAYYGYKDFVELFLAHGASTKLTGHGNAREISMRRGFQELVLLLSRHDKVPLPSPDAAMLIDAITAGDLDGVEEALIIGVSANSLDFTGRPVLALAARLGHDKIVQALLGRGADIHGLDQIGFTALMEATRDNQFTVAQLLLEAGAKANQRSLANALMLAPIHMAALSDNPEMVTLIAEAGADLNSLGRDGGTALSWCLGAGKNEAAARLLELGANPYITSKFGFSAADFIAERGSDTLKALLKPADSFPS